MQSLQNLSCREKSCLERRQCMQTWLFKQHTSLDNTLSSPTLETLAPQATASLYRNQPGYSSWMCYHIEKQLKTKHTMTQKPGKIGKRSRYKVQQNQLITPPPAILARRFFGMILILEKAWRINVFTSAVGVVANQIDIIIRKVIKYRLDKEKRNTTKS